MSRLKTNTARRLDVPEAIRIYLTTGQHPNGGECSWQLWEALYGPLGSSRAEQDAWDPDVALEPYKAALRAEGVALFEDVEMDGDN